MLRFSMITKKAIKLPSSKEVFCHGNGDFEKNTLIALLEEGWRRKLKSNDKIITTEDYLPHSFYKEGGKCPTENDLKFKKEIISYGELKKIYERMFDQKYSPYAEQERSNFENAVIERRAQGRAAWGNYIATMDYLRQIEEAREEQRLENECDKEGLAKLRAKQDKRYRL